MTDFKINQDIQNLLKMGLPEDMAQVVAFANNGKPEAVEDIVSMMAQEHELMMKELENFVPFDKKDDYIYMSETSDEEDEKPVKRRKNNSPVSNIDESDKENQESDLQHQQ